MRLIITAVALASLVLAGGCRNPTPTFNPHSAFGTPTVAPPPAGGYPTSSVPGRSDTYFPGIQQPAGVAPGYTQPTTPIGLQPQNQQPVGTGGGWQASNSTNPVANTASVGGLPNNTAVNRAMTPNISNGTLNDASYGGANTPPRDPASSLLERIQRGRMPVHDATAPPGASVPGPVPGYPAAPGYPPAPGYPYTPAYPAAAPTQPAYQLSPSMTATPGYSQLRGTALTSSAPRAAALPSSSPTERSVLVTTPSSNSPTALSTESPSSGDGLKWRSKTAPSLEVAKR